MHLASQPAPTLEAPSFDVARLYEPMLTTAQAAQLLGVTQHFMFKDRRRKPAPLIPFVKIGASVKYRLSDLKAFIEQNIHRSA